MGFGALMARRDAAKRAGVSANAGDARIPCTICLAVSGLSISAEMRDASIGSAVPVPVESVTKSITHSEIVRRARLHGETGVKASDRLELWPAPAAAEAPAARPRFLGAATGLVCGLNVGSSAESSERSLEPRLPRALAITATRRGNEKKWALF
jgi:hypothetical protein